MVRGAWWGKEWCVEGKRVVRGAWCVCVVRLKPKQRFTVPPCFRRRDKGRGTLPGRFGPGMNPPRTTPYPFKVSSANCLRYSARRAVRSGLPTARMATARRAALAAPSTATVATGTPVGI